jgi:hypothetical protein
MGCSTVRAARMCGPAGPGAFYSKRARHGAHLCEAGPGPQSLRFSRFRSPGPGSRLPEPRARSAAGGPESAAALGGVARGLLSMTTPCIRAGPPGLAQSESRGDRLRFPRALKPAGRAGAVTLAAGQCSCSRREFECSRPANGAENAERFSLLPALPTRKGRAEAGAVDEEFTAVEHMTGCLQMPAPLRLRHSGVPSALGGGELAGGGGMRHCGFRAGSRGAQPGLGCADWAARRAGRVGGTGQTVNPARGRRRGREGRTERFNSSMRVREPVCRVAPMSQARPA